MSEPNDEWTISVRSVCVCFMHRCAPRRTLTKHIQHECANNTIESIEFIPEKVECLLHCMRALDCSVSYSICRFNSKRIGSVLAVRARAHAHSLESMHVSMWPKRLSIQERERK